jgi:hypothetical protein
MLQVPERTTDSTDPWTARLRYAYADALLAVGRREEAREWFSRAADVDTEGETDAAERLLELDGVVIEGDEEDEESAEAIASGPGTPGAVPARPDADLTGDAESTDRDADERRDRAGSVDERDEVGSADERDEAAVADVPTDDLSDDELSDDEARSVAADADGTETDADGGESAGTGESDAAQR